MLKIYDIINFFFRLLAEMKLTEKSTHGLVTEFGKTWFQALKPEFSKPYFIKVYTISYCLLIFIGLQGQIVEISSQNIM